MEKKHKIQNLKKKKTKQTWKRKNSKNFEIVAQQP